VVRAVVFDIGGVLEITPDTGWRDRWADQLGMSVEEAALGARLVGSQLFIINTPSINA
jgi:hypothetical protein